MQADQYSRTALATAFYLAQHHLHDEPKLLDDAYAHRLLTSGEMAALTKRYIRDGIELGFPPDNPQALLARTLREATAAPTVLSRARYNEDRLAMAVERGVGQYVLIGAGLDTFAFRRHDMRDRLQVFELDHPRSQALKRERLIAAGLADPPNLHFCAIDFEREGVAEALGRTSFRRDQPASFAWLGVTMYLTRAAIEGTWRATRRVAAPGSELVFDFIHSDALAGEASPAMRKRPELGDDPNFSTSTQRIEHVPMIRELIQKWLDSSSDEECIRLLEENRIPVAPVLTVAEAVNHPHLRQRGTVATVRDRVLGAFDVPASPWRFSEFPGSPDLQAPFLGEHNATILKRHLGYSDQRLEQLTAQRILHCENR